MYIYGTITETFVEFDNRDLNKPTVLRGGHNINMFAH